MHLVELWFSLWSSSSPEWRSKRMAGDDGFNRSTCWNTQRKRCRLSNEEPKLFQEGDKADVLITSTTETAFPAASSVLCAQDHTCIISDSSQASLCGLPFRVRYPRQWEVRHLPRVTQPEGAEAALACRLAWFQGLCSFHPAAAVSHWYRCHWQGHILSTCWV